MRNVISLFGKAIVWSGLLGSLLSVTSVLSPYHLFFDLLSNFRIQYIALIIGVLLVALLSQRPVIASIMGICLLVHVVDVARAWVLPSESRVAAGPVIRVMASNLLASNTAYEKQLAYIRSIDPDIIVFPEYTQAWEAALSTALVEYRYRITAPIDSPFGIALYSKFLLTDQKTTYLEHPSRPSVEATATIGAHTLRIIGTHPPAPITNDLYLERNSHLLKIAAQAQSLATPMVILGDLNITPWSGHFRKFINAGNLTDGRRGMNIMPTWPVFLPVLQIPIDHVIVNDAVEVKNMEASEGLSSDHHAVWADIQLR